MFIYYTFFWETAAHYEKKMKVDAAGLFVKRKCWVASYQCALLLVYYEQHVDIHNSDQNGGRIQRPLGLYILAFDVVIGKGQLVH